MLCRLFDFGLRLACLVIVCLLLRLFSGVGYLWVLWVLCLTLVWVG